MANDKCTNACNVIDPFWLDTILFKKTQIREVTHKNLTIQTHRIISKRYLKIRNT